MKEIIKQLSQYESELFIEHLKGTKNDENKIIEILKKSIVQPEAFQIHNISKREERNNFYEKIILALEKNELKETLVFLSKKIEIINLTEYLHDQISIYLKDTELYKKSTDKIIWSLISKAEKDYYDVTLLVDEKLENFSKNAISDLGISSVTDKTGNEFSPDTAYDKIINSLSLSLKLISYKDNLYENELSILPEKIVNSVVDRDLAFDIQLLAISWKTLEEISQRSLLFNGEVFSHPSNTLEKGTKESFHFKREETNFEIFDAISNERLNKKIFQNTVEIMHDKNSDKQYVKDFSKVKCLDKKSFFSIDEITTLHTLKNIYCVDPLKDESSYSGLTLFEWVRSYSCLKYISEQRKDKTKGEIITKDQLLKYLFSSGIRKEKAIIFLKVVTFGKYSRDLFDCPLLKFRNNSYYFFSFALNASNLSNIIMSRLSSLETNVDAKGYRFETSIINLISKAINPCKNFKFKRLNEEYEYDGVFIFDDKIFLLECKNRALSGFNPVSSFRKQALYDDTVDQIIRLKSALLKYPEVIKEHFSVNINDYQVVPIILNCMPFSWKGTYKDVYCTDVSSLERFLKSSSINEITSSIKETKQERAVYKLWLSDKPSASDLIKQLENPIQLQEYINCRSKHSMYLIANKTTRFLTETFYTDYRKQTEFRKRMYGL